MSTRAKVILGVVIWPARRHHHRRCLRLGGQERRLQAAERVQARPLGLDQDRRARPLDQQGRPLPLPRRRGHHRRRWSTSPSACRQRPNRVQTAVEAAYDAHARQHHARATWTREMATKWFPFIGTLFLFIWFSNMIGYIPLPTNTERQVRHLRRSRSRRSRSTRRRRTSRSRSCSRCRVVQLPRRGHPRQGLLRLPQELDPRRRRGRAPRPDLRHRGDLALRAASSRSPSDCSRTSSPATC